MTDRPQVLKDLLDRARGPGPEWSCRSRRSTSWPGRGGSSPTAWASIEGDDAVDLRASSPRGATGWATRSSATSACGPATSSPGCAATPTSCSRRTTACCWRAACCCRSTSGWRPPSCAPSSTTAARPCCSATRTSPIPGTPSGRSLLGDEHEALLAAQPDGPVPHARRSTSGRRPSSSTRRARPARPKGALLSHRGLYLHADPQRADDGPHRRRRAPPHDPAVPRQRVGHAALRHRARRRARAAPPLRRRRGAAPRRGAARHAPLPRARHGPPRPRPPVVGRSATCRACGRSRSAARRRPRRCSPSSRPPSGARHLRLRHDRVEPDPHAQPPEAGPPVDAARSAPPPGCRSSASTCGCSATATSRCRGTARPSARSAPARNHVMIGYLDAPEATDGGAARRLAAHRRPRRRRRRRLPHDRRPSQGPHRVRRREHRVGGGGAGARARTRRCARRPSSACPTSGGARCRARSSRLVPGRAGRRGRR